MPTTATSSTGQRGRHRLGLLLYRFRLLRRATETWVAAFASAPLVLMYPLFLVIFGRSAPTIVMIGSVAGLPPVILKTMEGLAGTRALLIDVGRSFQPRRLAALPEDPASRRDADGSSSACGSA